MTQIAKPNSLVKQNVPMYLEQISQKIEEIKKRVPGGRQDLPPIDGFGKISDLKNTEHLIKAYSSIFAKFKLYDEAVEHLELEAKTVPPVKIHGHSLEEWKKAVLYKFNELSNHEELEKLEKAKKILERNLSEEAKFQKEMEEVANLLIE